LKNVEKWTKRPTEPPFSKSDMQEICNFRSVSVDRCGLLDLFEFGGSSSFWIVGTYIVVAVVAAAVLVAIGTVRIPSFNIF